MKKGDFVKFKLHKVGGLLDGIEGKGIVEGIYTGGLVVNVNGNKLMVKYSDIIKN